MLAKSRWDMSWLSVALLRYVQVDEITLQDGCSTGIKDRDKGLGNEIRNSKDNDHGEGSRFNCINFLDPKPTETSGSECNHESSDDHEHATNRAYKAKFGGIFKYQAESV